VTGVDASRRSHYNIGMRGGSAVLACLGTLGALLLCGVPAQASEPRIINGQPASQGEYPAQGVLRRNGDFICGGTLVSNRYFLTAAHCVTNQLTGLPLPTGQFSVTLGEVDRDAGTTLTFSNLEVNADFDVDTLDNDSALFTLSTPAPASLDPLRLIEAPPGRDETSLWSAGKQATVIGWGLTVDGDDTSDSQVLLETVAPMRADQDCSAPSAYGTDFHATTMVCAGDGTSDTCQGDSGGPLMVSDGSFLVLAGLTSWGGPCASSTQPGVYTRLGAPALNQWVRDRVPMARATVSDGSPDTGQTVSFTATAVNPDVPGYFTGFAWDFESDGTIDAQDATPSHTYTEPGNYVARVRATGSGTDTAVAKVRVLVASPPPPAPPAPPPAPPGTQPNTTQPIPRANLATILASGRPKVRRGRFHLRINFAQDAPPGIAVIEVFRGTRKIGTAKTRVRRGGSKRVTVKLNKRGRRLLRKSETGRLRVRVRVRVGKRVLGSRGLTIRR
jgi:secreted trypsin-like serine protease